MLDRLMTWKGKPFMTRTDEGTGRFPGCTIEGDARAHVTGVASPASASAEDLIYVDSAPPFDRAAGFRSKMRGIAPDFSSRERFCYV